jgi:type IV pilus assembly protein PilP
MWRRPRKVRRRGEDSLFLLMILVFLAFDVALAKQEAVYKNTRPPKETSMQKLEGVKPKDPAYLYDPTGKTDPFKSFIAIQEEMKEKKRRKPKTYLETVDLSQLELSVVIKSRKGNWALVRDSKGLGHVVKKGTAIGTNGGVVHEIKKNELVIREEFLDFRGRKKHRNISKKLPSLE